jgi:hypothetical protein
MTDSASCPIVNAVVRVTPDALAVIVAVSAVGEAPISTANVAVVWPGRTTTEPGTDATGVLLARDTASPPAGAGAVSVTVPCTCVPATETLFDRKTVSSAATVTTVVTRVAVWFAPA